ncbi:DUF4157 domain-containing protein [Archangium minus]
MKASQGLTRAERPHVHRGPRSGQSLPEEVLRGAEELFGEDFSDVRVYVSAEARRRGVRAFTIGSDIYFAPGQYEPTSEQGLRLLGHELAHVVQQRAGKAHNPYGYGLAAVRDPALEQQADRMGGRMVMQLAVAQPSSSSERKAIEEEISEQGIKAPESKTYFELRERGFSRGQIDWAGSGTANADFYAADGTRIWIVEVKGQNNWMSISNIQKSGNVPAKQLGAPSSRCGGGKREA